MNAWRFLLLFCVPMLLMACGKSAEQKAAQQAAIAEHRRIECLDKICPGDKEPMLYDHTRYQLFKRGGRFFLGPREYGFYEGSASFYWPSKHPVAKAGEYSEKGKVYADVAIDIFLRSNNIPAEPNGYALVQLAEKNGWIDSRKTIRAGLDQIRMKHVIGPQGQYIDHVAYYVATEMTGSDGFPPVATCNHDNANNGGGTGFMWKPGIWAGTRMNQKHCADWPEIYQETIRVLSLVKEIK